MSQCLQLPSDIKYDIILTPFENSILDETMKLSLPHSSSQIGTTERLSALKSEPRYFNLPGRSLAVTRLAAHSLGHGSTTRATCMLSIANESKSCAIATNSLKR